MKRSQVDMLSGPLLKNVIAFSIPIILTSLLQLFFNAADLIVVGRFCGSISVGAVGATGAITNLIINVFIGLSVGAGVTVAQCTGAKDHDGVRKTVHTAVLTALIGGLILTFVGVAFSGTFLRLMDTPENVLPLSTVYMQIYFAGAVSMLVYNFGAAILRAVGDTKRPLYFLSIAGVVNVVLNLIFVTVFHMNVAGVALATTISQTVSATLVVLTLMRRQDACRLVLKELKIHGEQFGRIIKIGLPAGIQGSLFAISNVLIQSSINSFVEIAVSGNAAAGNIEAFVWVMMNAFQQSALNFIGQNMGAKQYGRLKKIMWVCIGCVAAVGLVFGNLAFLFGRPLLGIYITDSAEAIEYGLIRMTFIAVPYLLCGVMDVATGCLRGVGKSMTAMIITIAGACGFRLFWIYTIFRIPAMHTPHSLYMSYPISWAMTFAVELICFIAVVKKLNSNKEPEQA